MAALVRVGTNGLPASAGGRELRWAGIGVCRGGIGVGACRVGAAGASWRAAMGMATIGVPVIGVGSKPGGTGGVEGAHAGRSTGGGASGVLDTGSGAVGGACT